MNGIKVREFEEQIKVLGDQHKYDEIISLCIKNWNSESEDIVLQANIARSIAISYFYKAEYEEALHWNNLFSNLVADIDNKQLQAKAAMGKGGCYYHLHQLDKAEKFLKEALTIYEELDNDSDLAYAYNWMGIVYNSMNNVYLALDMNIKALEKANKINLVKIVESASTSIALSFMDLDDIDKAKEFFDSAINANAITKNPSAKADILNNVGMLLRQDNHVKESIPKFKNSIEIREKYFPKDYARIAHSYCNLGTSEFLVNDFVSAKKHYYHALDLYKKLPVNSELLQKVMCQLALIYVRSKNYSKAKEFLNMYLVLERQSKKKYFIDLYYRVSYEYYYNLEDYKKAIKFLDLNATYRVEEAKRYTRKVVEDMEMRLEFEKKKVEAEIYKLKNEELAKAINTRDKLFSVISHDLRGPVSNIIEVIKLLQEDRNSIDPNELEIVFSELLNSATNAYNLLQNLLSWARLQMKQFTPNLSSLSIPEIVSDCIQQTEYRIKKKRLKIVRQIKCSSKAYGDKNMIDFIIRNVVTNAIKFSNPGGVITFSTSCDLENEYVKISDNGVGISKSKLNTLFSFSRDKSTRGTANEQGSGLGLLLCKDFITLNHGKIEVESEPGKGTSVIITLPKATI